MEQGGQRMVTASWLDPVVITERRFMEPFTAAKPKAIISGTRIASF